MEAKKNPDHDVHRLSSRFFLVGLIISISLALTAFEWTIKKKKVVPPTYDPPLEAILQVQAHTEERTPTPPSPLPKKERTPIEKIEFIPTDLVPDTDTDDGPQPDIDLDIPTDLPGGGYVLPPEDTVEIFVSPQVHPKPVGGYDSFYKQIAKSLRYPKRASREEIEGKVFVEFVITREGAPTQIKVIKGIGGGCDEEAMRVVALTRWEPGRQRGRPVKTRMTLPIHFKIR